MTSLINNLREMFTQKQALEPGFLVYHTAPEAPKQYRLHLRVEPDGEGVLIINASSILHLNQSATEIAYYNIKGKSNTEIAKLLAQRFTIRPDIAAKDVDEFLAKIQNFIETVDLRPDADFGFETHLNIENISAPYRLDCCLTYELESGQQFLEPRPLEKFLSTQDWKTLIKRAYDAAIPHLIFYGGEPTLRDDLLELLSYSEELGLVTGLVSSGRKLGDPEYVNSLIACGLDHLMIPWVLSDAQMREALNHILPLDLYTCINLPIQQGFDYRPLILELKALGANAFSLAPVTENDYSYFLELSDYVESLEGVDLVQDMPLPAPAETFDRQEEILDYEVDDSAFTIMKVDTRGNLHTSFPPYPLLGNMVTEEWKTLWERRPKNANS
ncbi:MAG TPA: PqqD family peptide modification chaperone [Anaerolineaceae bacterium]|nr:PqqD family peptide modification chaperone [Anaerolineaceae bacterium]